MAGVMFMEVLTEGVTDPVILFGEEKFAMIKGGGLGRGAGTKMLRPTILDPSTAAEDGEMGLEGSNGVVKGRAAKKDAAAAATTAACWFRSMSS